LISPQAHQVEERIAEKKKDYAAAENEYRIAIKVSAGKAGTWLNLAGFYQHAGRLADMEDGLRHATDAEMHRPDLLVGAAEMRQTKDGMN